MDEASPSALERLLEVGTDEDIQRLLLALSPPETADLLEELGDGETRARVFRLILGRKQARVLRDMDDEERVELVEQLPPAETAGVLEYMKSDDAADVLQQLDEDHQQEVLDALDPADRVEIEKVLEHPEDSAGGIMQTELVRVRASSSVRDAIEEIRRTAEDTGELHEVFVVDGENRLVGWVKERDLILAEDATRIGAITTQVPVTVPVDMDQEEIATLVQDYDLSSVPVVDGQNRLVGRILVDDIVDVIHEEANEDILRQGGSRAEELYAPSIAMAVRSRFPWLVVTFCGGILAAFIMSAAEGAIRHAGALFAFIPVIMGTGGASGTQTATVTVRSLVTGRIDTSDLVWVVLKELAVGVVMAVVTGLLLLAVVQLRGGELLVAGIAAGALFGTIFLGTMFGVLIPLVMHRVGVDPAAATGPFVTTLNDVLGSSIIWALCLAFV
ncbi:MAG: magnesium transporter [Planctomycetota bacterium]